MNLGDGRGAQHGAGSLAPLGRRVAVLDRGRPLPRACVCVCVFFWLFLTCKYGKGGVGGSTSKIDILSN